MAFQLLPLPPKVYSPHSSQSHLFEKHELLSCDFRVENSSDGPITLKSRIETLHHGLLGARVTCTLTSPPISFPMAHSVAATLTFVSEPTKTATSSGLWHWLVPLPRIPCALLTGSLTLIRDPPITLFASQQTVMILTQPGVSIVCLLVYCLCFSQHKPQKGRRRVYLVYHRMSSAKQSLARRSLVFLR